MPGAISLLHDNFSSQLSAQRSKTLRRESFGDANSQKVHMAQRNCPPQGTDEKKEEKLTARRVRYASLHVCARSYEDLRSLCGIAFCVVVDRALISLGFPIHARISQANSCTEDEDVDRTRRGAPSTSRSGLVLHTSSCRQNERTT